MCLFIDDIIYREQKSVSLFILFSVKNMNCVDRRLASKLQGIKNGVATLQKKFQYSREKTAALESSLRINDYTVR